MNLGLSNGAKKSTNIQEFLKELGNYLKSSKDHYNNKEEDIVDKESKMVTEYRDEFYLKRNNILINYANKSLGNGQMYYIYSKNSKDSNMYNLCICEEGRSHIVIEENIDKLPKGANLETVLRKKNGSYILDDDATMDVKAKIEELKNRILEEQERYLKENRIEGNIYELSEKAKDRVWLFNITNNNQEVFEEIEFPKELLEEAKEGDKFLFKEGKYIKI